MGKQQPDGSVKTGELMIIRERHVELHALQIGPAMPIAVKNSVVCSVNFRVFTCHICVSIRGFIHGCMAVGMSRASMGSSKSFIRWISL